MIHGFFEPSNSWYTFQRYKINVNGSLNFFYLSLQKNINSGKNTKLQLHNTSMHMFRNYNQEEENSKIFSPRQSKKNSEIQDKRVVVWSARWGDVAARQGRISLATASGSPHPSTATCWWWREECGGDANQRQCVFFKQLGGNCYCYHDVLKMV